MQPQGSSRASYSASAAVEPGSEAAVRRRCLPHWFEGKERRAAITSNSGSEREGGGRP